MSEGTQFINLFMSSKQQHYLLVGERGGGVVGVERGGVRGDSPSSPSSWLSCRSRDSNLCWLLSSSSWWELRVFPSLILHRVSLIPTPTLILYKYHLTPSHRYQLQITLINTVLSITNTHTHQLAIMVLEYSLRLGISATNTPVSKYYAIFLSIYIR